MDKTDTIQELAAALSGFQGEVKPATFDAVNPFLKNHYATYGALSEAAKPYLAKYGLSVTQLIYSEGDQIGVETMLMHKSGEWLSTKISMATADEKGKSSAQVAGSIVSYLRRYSYAGILGLYAEADDDGNGAPRKHDWQPAAKIEPEIKVEAEAPALTLEDALKHLNSQNVPYGDLESNTLKIMWNAMAKSITKNHLDGEKKAELEYKMKLCKMITDAREAGEIADK